MPQFDAAGGHANAAMTLADGALARTGLQWLRDAMDGTTAVPPFVHELGIRLERADKGLVIGTFAPHPRHLNGLATLHGGVIATLADTVASCAVLSIAPVGVITPMTHTYCGSCNRVRLTADGRLRTCLYGDHEVNLRDPLRRGEALEPLFRRALAEKPLEHDLLQLKVGGLRALSQVGG